MRAAIDLWRERMWVWLIPLAFFAVNLSFLSLYRVVYAGQVQLLQSDLERRSDDLEEQIRRRQELEQLLEQAEVNQDRLRVLYNERLSTERQRLTSVIAEVKELAQRSGLVPEAISYPEERIQDYGLVKKSLVFSVVGTYVSLRKFINFLELSDSFLILEQVGLSETGGNQPRLSISLRISALFADGLEDRIVVDTRAGS